VTVATKSGQFTADGKGPVPPKKPKESGKRELWEFRFQE